MAGEFLARESNRTSLITVTHADMSPDLKRGTIYLSVLPESEEQKALEFAKRNLTEFREYVREKSVLRFLPVFDFELDMGEKNRQRVSDLMK